MLIKLLKQDFLIMRRWFLPAYAAFLVIFIPNKITFDQIHWENPFKISSAYDMITFFLLFLYIVAIIGLYILSFVFTCMHFYRTMAGNQGYFTHTLPIKTETIILSKMICAVFWQAVSGLLILLSIFVMSLGHWGGKTFYQLISDYFLNMQPIFSMTPLSFLSTTLITSIIGLFSNTLMLYSSIALGHLFLKHKIGGAVLAYAGMYMVMQTAGSFILAFNGYFTALLTKTHLPFQSIMIQSTLLSVVFSVFWYIITVYVFKKKLNLN